MNVARVIELIQPNLQFIYRNYDLLDWFNERSRRAKI